MVQKLRSKKRSYGRLLSWFIGSLGGLCLVLLFNNCSSGSSGAPAVPAPDEGRQGTTSWSLLKSENLELLDKEYLMQMMKLETPRGAVFIQFISACSSRCPLVIVSQPYAGIDWSDEARDLRWAVLPGSEAGFWSQDEDGPGRTSTSTGELWYQKYSPTVASSFGALFLPNGISIAIVYGRFYRGNSLEKNVLDHIAATEALSRFKEVDASQIGMLGISLGGFISAHSAAQGTVPIKAMSLLAPLLDLKDQWSYVLEDLPSSITTNPPLRLEYQNFFEPYLNRVLSFAGGSPQEKPSIYAKFSIDTIAPRIPNSFQLIHDSWDMLVPFRQSTRLKSLNPSSVHEIWHQHSKPADPNSFQKDHGQSGEGFSMENSGPFYLSFLNRRLLPDSREFKVFYRSNLLTQTFTEMRAAQIRGQNISWLQSILLEWCQGRASFVDMSNVIGVRSGPEIVQDILKNIWGQDHNLDQVCPWIKEHPL